MPSKKPFWEQKNPKAEKGKSKKLTAAQKMRAKKRAEANSRVYPNLIDNAYVARNSKG